jgi:ribosome assembly protein RRB1
MKWSDMVKTAYDDDSCDDSDEEHDRRDPTIRFETVPHRGGINRIRSMHGSPIVATWSEEGEVGIYNIAQAVDALDRPVAKQQASYGGSKISGFKNRAEGYALDWSPSTFGRLAAGANDASLWLY